MRHVELFAGVGAVGIAAEHLGYETTDCVEIDPFCREILRLRYPRARIHEDVRNVGAAELLPPGGGASGSSRIDLISGGFP